MSLSVLRQERGNALIFPSALVTAVVMAMLSVLYMTEARRQKTLLKSASTQENFYAVEIAQVNAFIRLNLGLDLSLTPDSRGYITCNLTPDYRTAFSALPTESYSPSSSETAPFNLKTTSQFDISENLNEKLARGGLFYSVENRP